LILFFVFTLSDCVQHCALMLARPQAVAGTAWWRGRKVNDSELKHTLSPALHNSFTYCFQVFARAPPLGHTPGAAAAVVERSAAVSG
jgi:hypothetical protein